VAATAVVLLARCASAVSPGNGTVLSVATTFFRVDIFGNCSAVATNLRTHAASKPNELLSSYNRVADNHLTDWSPCVGASLVALGVVRVSTANGYGHVDIGVSTSCVPAGTGLISCVPGWMTFEVRNISGWHADPIQKHLVFGSLCPADLCPTGAYPSAAATTAQGQTTDLTRTGNVSRCTRRLSAHWSAWHHATPCVRAQPEPELV
jgi:hypothetical protein